MGFDYFYRREHGGVGGLVLGDFVSALWAWWFVADLEMQGGGAVQFTPLGRYFT